MPRGAEFVVPPADECGAGKLSESTAAGCLRGGRGPCPGCGSARVRGGSGWLDTFGTLEAGEARTVGTGSVG